MIRLEGTKTFVPCALFIVFLMGADSATSPIVARVTVFYHRTGEKAGIAYQQLPDPFDQLHMLSLWWEKHLAGWKQSNSSTPSGSLFITLKLKHADGTIDEVIMREGPGDSREAELRTGLGGCGIWPQESICNQNSTQRFVQIFTAQEMKSFWKASRGNLPESRGVTF
jgi:hypothetical protein